MYDGDKAGRAATLKALRVLAAAEVDVRIVAVPAGDDPDTLVKRLGPEKFADVIERAQGGIQYFAYEVWGKNTGSGPSHAEVLTEAATLGFGDKKSHKERFCRRHPRKSARHQSGGRAQKRRTCPKQQQKSKPASPAQPAQ